MEAYHYKLDVFEGPLDLLLHLIEKHKIDIYDIPIVEITSQYMAQLAQWQEFDMHYSSEFLVMAATLLQIKSRMLLPQAATAETEDPRDELVSRLLEFKKIKELTNFLLSKQESGEQFFARPEQLSQWGVEAVYQFEAGQLFTIFKEGYSRLKERPTAIPNVKVEKESYTIEKAMESLLRRVHGQKGISFKTYIAASVNKEDGITRFLAVLELLKMQLLTLTIVEDGEDLIIESVKEELAQHGGSTYASEFN